MNEIWKDVNGYEGIYQVSNFGNVKSLNYNKTKIEMILKTTIDTQGYFHVVLCKSGIVKSKRIHQLVSEAFLNHTPSGYKLVVNHIDFNKLNNCVDNLEIVTARENTNRKHLKSSSQYTGVYWQNQAKKWHARIVINGKNKHIGYFADEYDAHLAYENELKTIFEKI